ncbi:MAG: 16S rRNA methyltransferase [Armatimonadetes bacterium]|nr:16S rRNA methyltransferase [Armatimonadota bacterium]
MHTGTLFRVYWDLLTSARHGRLCHDTLWRVADWAAQQYPRRPREATKVAKRKLHQIHGAYVRQLDLRRMGELVGALPEAGDAAALEAACRAILACHASTRERLAFVEELYPALFALTGVPSSVADLACGLNPFALPWMGLPTEVRYCACDIDGRIVDAVNALFAHTGTQGVAESRDLLASPPEWDVDMALLLKTAPCLEQQEKGATLNLLRGLRARHVVLSFPAQSLGGKGKGMRRTYAETASCLAETLKAETQRLDCPTETFFVLRLAR